MIFTLTELSDSLDEAENRLDLAVRQEFEADNEYRAADAALVIALDEAQRTTPKADEVDELTESHRVAVENATQTLRSRTVEVRLAQIHFAAVLHRIVISDIAGRNLNGRPTQVTQP